MSGGKRGGMTWLKWGVYNFLPLFVGKEWKLFEDRSRSVGRDRRCTCICTEGMATWYCRSEDMAQCRWECV